MKKILLLLMTAFMCSSCAKAETDPDPDPDPQPEESKIATAPCNANATAEAKALYTLLYSQYGKKSLSATVACVDWNIDEAQIVHNWTGKWPCINVFDYINIHASKDVNPTGWLDYSDMTVVNDWHKAGGIVGCMWHWQVKANDGNNYTCSPGTASGETDFDPECINDKSSADYKQLIKDLDQVAGYLKTMQKNGIAVIWRPLHEGSGNTVQYKGGKAWFWWGAKGAAAYRNLWRFIYDYFVNQKGLNNLIWVWNSQTAFSGGNVVTDYSATDDAGNWYPGDDVVDIIGRDNYDALYYPLSKEFKQLQSEHPTKMVTLAECGNGDVDDMSNYSLIWKQGGQWSWFMPWYDSSYQKGSDEHRYADKAWWLDAFNSGVVLSRDDIK